MKARIKEEIKGAMKARDQVKLETLRGVLSAMQYEEIQKGIDDLPEESTLAVIQSELKKRREEVEFAEKANRSDLKERLAKEISVLQAFLPAQLSTADLERLIGEFKSQNPGLNMGVAMKMLKDSYAGQYDGRAASEVAKKILG